MSGAITPPILHTVLARRQTTLLVPNKKTSLCRQGSVPHLVLMGSSYWMPFASSATPIRAFFSATLSKIFSSSFNWRSMALSFLAGKNYIYIYMCVCVCVCVCMYTHTHTHSHMPHNEVSINNRSHIRWWSHKIIILQYLTLCYNCLQYSVQQHTVQLNKDRPTWCHLLYYFTVYCSTCFEC